MNATHSTVTVTAPRATARDLLRCLGRWAKEADVFVVTHTRWCADGRMTAQVDLYATGTPTTPTPADQHKEEPLAARLRAEATRLHARLAAADQALERARAHAEPGSALWAAIRAYDLVCDDQDTPTTPAAEPDRQRGAQR